MSRWVAVGLAAFVLAGCGGDGKTLRDTVFDPPATVPLTTPPGDPTSGPMLTSPASTASSVIEATEATEATERTVVIDALFSPANATAEVSGRGALPGDALTVDGRPADVLSFTADDLGGLVAQVWIEDEGAHTVCVAETCGRVFTRAPDAESDEEVIAKIDAALPLAAEYLDVAAVFPEWTISIGGALSGTGGTTDIATQSVTIYRNRGRTTDDYVRTILHELGHVADLELLTDEERAEYLVIRGIAADMPWREEDSHRIEDWARQPSEDFAEVMVAIWTGGRWEPRTLVSAPPPTAEQLSAIAVLTETG